jgi:hypothetical protein
MYIEMRPRLKRLTQAALLVGISLVLNCYESKKEWLPAQMRNIYSSKLHLKTQVLPVQNFSDNSTEFAEREEETFSACLMVMDDNPRLVEWIAYHYLTMPLRHLVILPDPKSRSSPESVLDRWRSMMRIEVWNDDFIIDKDLEELGKRNNGFEFFTRRQEAFYKKCGLHLQHVNRTWVSFHDVDEYVAINEEVVSDAADRIQDSGSILKILGEVRAHRGNKTFVNQHYQNACVTTYRTLFSAVESSEQTLHQNIPETINPKKFDTLRWRYHKDHKNAQIGKSFIDVSKVPNMKGMGYPKRKGNIRWIHRVLPICKPPQYNNNAYIRIHHYLGSWSAYSHRPDTRESSIRGRKFWERDSTIQDGVSDELRPWIVGFVKLFGEQKARDLLDGAGFSDTPALLQDTPYGNCAGIPRFLKAVLGCT